MKILKFTAAWCWPCRTYAPVVKAWAAERGIEVETIDIEKDEDASRKYRIQSLPTTIFVDDAGKRLARAPGMLTNEELVKLHLKALRGAK